MMRFSSLFLAFGLLAACGNTGHGKKEVQPAEPAVQEVGAEVFPVFGTTDDGMPAKLVFAEAQDKGQCFFVISKVPPVHLSVYEASGADTLLLAIYPACVARNKGQKQVRGDNKTPESWPGKPFSITQIQDASEWYHDFGDGRGSILSYGHWFMRLETPGFSGIGIHGSTGNRESIRTGRGSEGCIRLLDEDIIHLKEHYARKGTPVIILPENQGPLPFETAAYGARKREGAVPVQEVETAVETATAEPGRPRR